MKKNEIKLKRGKTIKEFDFWGNGVIVELYELIPMGKESDNRYNLTQGGKWVEKE